MLNIGLFGVGVVGGGVVNIIKEYQDVKVVKAFVRDKAKDRQLQSDIVLVDNASDILDDPSIDCIVEVMGGTDFAWNVVKGAILKNKHVVTANKALIAMYMNELVQLLKEHPTVRFMYEAAVCGGIPIINALQRSYAPDRVTEIVGILNGTTNYVLSKMESDRLSLSEVVKEAQAKGYAESDPSADVEGWDARAKLCVLTRLVFGICVDESKVPCQGISQIDSEDFEYARMLKRTIKLLGIVTEVDASGALSISVTPAMVPLCSPLAHVSGATNAVEVHSEYLGTSLFVGPGAGRYPTANSIVADILALKDCSKTGYPCLGHDKDGRTVAEDYSAEFYFRLVVNDQIGVIHKISGILAQHEIPIFSILQTPIIDQSRVPFAVITETCRLSDVKKVLKIIDEGRSGALDFVVAKPVCLRYFPDKN